MNYKFPVPKNRGISDPEIIGFDIVAQGAGGGNLGGGGSADPQIRDMVVHAAICRIAYEDDTTEEFHTQYDPNTRILDIDIPDTKLDLLMRAEVGPKLDRYFSWLTNGVANLRRDTMQFTIGSSSAISIGMQGIGLTVGYDCQIERSDLLLISTADLELELWAVPANQWPGNSSFALGTIEISAGISNVDANISDWNIELRRGDVIVYNVLNTNTSGIQLATVTLYVCKYSTFESA